MPADIDVDKELVDVDTKNGTGPSTVKLTSSIGNTQSGEDLDTLISLLKQTDPNSSSSEQRVMVERAVIQLCLRERLPELIEIACNVSYSAEVRRTFLRIMAQIPDERSCSTMVSLLHDADPAVAADAINCLIDVTILPGRDKAIAQIRNEVRGAGGKALLFRCLAILLSINIYYGIFLIFTLLFRAFSRLQTPSNWKAWLKLPVANLLLLF